MWAREVVASAEASLVGASLDFRRFVNGLVNPVPDGHANDARARLGALTIFRHVASGAAHGVCHFADEHRLVEGVAILVHPTHSRIHF